MANKQQNKHRQTINQDLYNNFETMPDAGTQKCARRTTYDVRIVVIFLDHDACERQTNAYMHCTEIHLARRTSAAVRMFLQEALKTKFELGLIENTDRGDEGGGGWRGPGFFFQTMNAVARNEENHNDNNEIKFSTSRNFGATILVLLISCLLHLVATAYFFFLEILGEKVSMVIFLHGVLLWGSNGLPRNDTRYKI